MASVSDNGVHGYGQQQGAGSSGSSSGSVVQGVADQAKRAGAAAAGVAKGQVMKQAETGKGVLVQGLGELIQVLETASEQTQSEWPRKFIHQATGYLRNTSEAIERGTPEDLLRQAGSQMRARPLASIAGLFAAGFLAGRLLKV